jgi:3-hydroxyacyl-[acyl-carrier-protein] dehydratase
MPPSIILDPTQIDTDVTVADARMIEAVNPHRHGMRMVDKIVYVDLEQHVLVGYKDCRNDEFWVPGHMPGYPIFPGVLMCEAAAQLASYYFIVYGGLYEGGYLGLGGIENARFRSPVRPGDRLMLIGRGIKIDRRKMEFEVQGYVRSTMAFNLNVIGVPIPGQKKEKPVKHFAEAFANGTGG